MKGYSSEKKRERISYWVRSFLFILISLVMIAPLVLMVLTSLKTSEEASAAGFQLLPAVPQFQNYIMVLTDSNWPLYLWNSLVTTVITTAVSLVFNLLAGFAFSRLDFPLRKPLFYSVLVGLMVPMQVNLIPVFMILKSIPFLGGNNILGQGGPARSIPCWELCCPGWRGPSASSSAVSFIWAFPGRWTRRPG